MPYKLGVVGIGHWFFRLHEGILKTDDIQLLKVASASGYEKHRMQLEKLKIPEPNYFQIAAAEEIPKDFFDGIDIVHIADPNEFHAAQTLQALKHNKIVIVEKTLGINRTEFEKVVDYIKENGMESKAYLHLHYAHKLLTTQLPDMLKRFTKQYGSITHTSATFFERENEDRLKRRLWLFDQKNGGLFMDWIHPFETYYEGAFADKMDLVDVTPYILNPEYSTQNPTGIHAKVKINGMFFTDDAQADIRVAIGLKSDHETKSIRFIFESGQCLDLSFVNSEIEYSTDNRGSWALYERPGGRIIEANSPKGPTASDILVNDILELCRGRNPGFSLNDLNLIYEPQWRYQEMVKKKKLVKGKAAVDAFIKEGLNIPPNQKVL